MPRNIVLTISALLFGLLFATTSSVASLVEYELTIAEQEINLSGRPVKSMTINGGIPGPVLDFTEGDLARISVRNAMTVATSIHWHGILVPPEMDGVPFVSFPPIAPGTTFIYEFPIRQSGTYWYHSHTSLQEQSGVYGAIRILPRTADHPADIDRTIMLSDWTEVDPHEVLRTLKRGSDWMALEKGSAQSLIGAARVGRIGDYFAREMLRMPAMDIADISYDRFLANGQPALSLADTNGKTVRLRIINGGAGTNFYLEFAGGPMTIVSADGQPVEPFVSQRFLIAIAETYDIFLEIPDHGVFELRATSQDGSGYASVLLGEGTVVHAAPDIPKPNLYQGHVMGGAGLGQIFALTPAGAMGMSDADVIAGRFDSPGMAMEHGEMGHGTGTMLDHTQGMTHGKHDMIHDEQTGIATSTEELEALFSAGDPAGGQSRQGTEEDAQNVMNEEGETLRRIAAHRSGKSFGTNFRWLAADVASAGALALDGMSTDRPWPPYEQLRSPHPTAFPPGKQIREIRLTLDGDMERYVWFLNNKPLAESDSILIHEGEVVRFIMINRTMMHHPMHLHGHFFRVVNGQGDRAPLKHTVNVAPMSTTVIEFNANEVGDWFFHCHLLYHMKSGMARVVSYENFTLEPRVAEIRPSLYEDSWYAWGEADILTNMFEGSATIANTRNDLSLEWEVGWQNVDGSDWEALLTWDRYINRFFSVFTGVDLGDAIEDDRAVIGFHYLLPFLLETRAFAGSDGDSRVMLSKHVELLPRLSIEGVVQYDSDSYWEYTGNLSYTLSKALSLHAKWHSDYRWGVGMQIRF